MDYRGYSAGDLVMDEFFRQWVREENPEAKVFWEAWLVQHPDQAEVIDEARRILQAMNFTSEALPAGQQQRMYSNILLGIGQYQAATAQPGHSSWWLRPVPWYRAAAAVILLAVAGLAGWWYLNLRGEVQYATGFGQMQTIELPDGSEVILNANSKLSYPADWQHRTDREVWLEGEAFFQVRKQKRDDAPVKFRVHSGDVNIEVLGTRFTVSDREENTHVVLDEGSIRLAVPGRSGTENILMEPGELVEYREKDREVIRRRVNAEVYNSWKNNKWILQDIRLALVARRIEETYGVKVSIPDSRLARESMTGVLPTSSLDKLLEVLSATYSLKIQRKENLLILTK